MEPAERKRLEEQTRIQTTTLIKTSVKLWLKIMAVVFGLIILGVAACVIF